MRPFYLSLLWNDSGLVAEHARLANARHLSHTSHLLRQLLQEFDGGLGGALENELLALPNEHLLRLLRAPELCRRLEFAGQGNQAEGVLGFVAESIRAEWQLSGEESSKSALWTALGDWRFEEGDNHCPVKSGHVLDGGVLIDFDSPYANQPIKASNFRKAFSEAVPYSEAEKISILALYRDAFEGANKSNKAAADFFKTIVQTVMPRRDVNNLTFRGSSNRGVLGRVNTYNPHLHYATSGMVCASLIHEAIHIYLYTEENESPFFDDYELAHEVRLVSSFSGKEVHLLAYVHAVFVWFGLLNFWFLPEVDKIFDRKTVNYYRGFCLQGFLCRRVENVIAPWADYIREGILQQIIEMQDFVSLHYE